MWSPNSSNERLRFVMFICVYFYACVCVCVSVAGLCEGFPLSSTPQDSSLSGSGRAAFSSANGQVPQDSDQYQWLFHMCLLPFVSTGMRCVAVPLWLRVDSLDLTCSSAKRPSLVSLGRGSIEQEWRSSRNHRKLVSCWELSIWVWFIKNTLRN